MEKRIVAVNAGSRKGWNTDTLIKEAARGAEDAGATVEYPSKTLSTTCLINSSTQMTLSVYVEDKYA